MQRNQINSLVMCVVFRVASCSLIGTNLKKDLGTSKLAALSSSHLTSRKESKT